ncbi:MAG: hypothetical protein IT372_32570 [Polyangiaceae bacterium]|nr:hypothetical protein [Polyangiaceae bacterium]
MAIRGAFIYPSTRSLRPESPPRNPRSAPRIPRQGDPEQQARQAQVDGFFRNFAGSASNFFAQPGQHMN